MPLPKSGGAALGSGGPLECLQVGIGGTALHEIATHVQTEEVIRVPVVEHARVEVVPGIVGIPPPVDVGEREDDLVALSTHAHVGKGAGCSGLLAEPLNFSHRVLDIVDRERTLVVRDRFESPCPAHRWGAHFLSSPKE